MKTDNSANDLDVDRVVHTIQNKLWPVLSGARSLARDVYERSQDARPMEPDEDDAEDVARLVEVAIEQMGALVVDADAQRHEIIYLRGMCGSDGVAPIVEPAIVKVSSRLVAGDTVGAVAALSDLVSATGDVRTGEALWMFARCLARGRVPEVSDGPEVTMARDEHEMVVDFTAWKAARSKGDCHGS